jgi:hypothetical protein
MRFFLFFLFLLFPSHAYAQDFIVIANKGGPLVEADMGLVREVYLGEKRFATDTKLRPVKFLPVNFTEGSLKDSFLKAVIGMSSKEYKHHWIKKVFQEGLSFPVTMGSPIGIIEFVGKEKGAVAYLPAGWADTIGQRDVRSETGGFLAPRGIEEVKIIGP